MPLALALALALGLALAACAPAAHSLPPTPDSTSAPGPNVVVVGERALVASEGGLELHVARWTVASAHGVAWFASVPRSGSLSIAASDAVRPLSEIVGASAPPWAAINGGFYEDGPMGLVVSGGVQSHAASGNGGSGVIQFGPAGASIVHRDAWAPGPTEALQSIDRLVDAGASLVHPRPDAHRDARSAVVISEDRLWIVAAVADNNVAVDPEGIQLVRTSGNGMSLAEFATFLVSELGAKQALNLDGAVSTQMVVTTSTWRWAMRGERGTINGVVLRPPSPEVAQ